MWGAELLPEVGRIYVDHLRLFHSDLRRTTSVVGNARHKSSLIHNLEAEDEQHRNPGTRREWHHTRTSSTVTQRKWQDSGSEPPLGTESEVSIQCQKCPSIAQKVLLQCHAKYQVKQCLTKYHTLKSSIKFTLDVNMRYSTSSNYGLLNVSVYIFLKMQNRI